MKFRPLLAAAVAATTLSVAQAELAQKPVSLDDCIQMALRHNFDVRIQRYGPRVAELALSSAYTAYDPTFTASAGQGFRRSEAGFNPSVFNPPSNENWNDNYGVGLGGNMPTGLRYDFFGDVSRSQSTTLSGAGTFTSPFDYSPDAGVRLTQSLLKNAWIDQTRWTIAVDKLALKSNIESVRGQIMTTLVNVELGYYNLISAYENVLVQGKALEVSERFLFETRKRVEVGALAPLDAEQAKAEVARLKADLVSARKSLGDQERALKQLLDEDFATSAGEMLLPTAKLQNVPALVNRTDSWMRAFDLRADYRQQKLALEQQKITLRFTRNQLYPQLDLSGGYGVTGRSSEFSPGISDLGNRSNPNYYWGLKLTFPLDNLSARNGHKKAKLDQEKLLVQFKQTEQSIMIQIDNDIRAVESARERIEATKQSRIYAEAAHEAEKKKLESGKSTNYQVLQLQRDLTQAQTQEISTLADYNKALARLAFDEGSTLTRLGVSIDLR